jgi:hypothetical protein
MGKRHGEGAVVKTCLMCGGTWPSYRRNCLACGANLESVPARPVAEGQGQDPLDWTWLDAMAEEGETPEAPDPADDEQKKGCLGRLFPA